MVHVVESFDPEIPVVTDSNGDVKSPADYQDGDGDFIEMPEVTVRVNAQDATTTERTPAPIVGMAYDYEAGETPYGALGGQRSEAPRASRPLRGRAAGVEAVHRAMDEAGILRKKPAES